MDLLNQQTRAHRKEWSDIQESNIAVDLNYTLGSQNLGLAPKGAAGSTFHVVLAKQEASLVLSPRVRISGSVPSLRYRLMPTLLGLSEDLSSLAL